MARYTECPPCQMGEHDRHYHVVQHPPEGGVGGAVCNCKGECRDVDPQERFERLVGPRVAAVLRRHYKGVR